MISSIALVFTLILLLVNSHLYSQNKNYKKLEEVNKKLQYNEITYSELLKIEKDLNQDLNKLKINIKKYRKHIIKGINKKNNLEKIISNSKQELEELKEYRLYITKNKSLMLNNLVYLAYKNNSSPLIKQSTKNIFITINNLEEINEVALLKLKKTIEVNNILLNKLNKSLNNIEFSLNSRSYEVERLIGEKIITAIEKAENKIEKNKIKKEVNEIKSLIQKFENTKKDIKKYDNFNFSKLNDILPVGRINIKNIETDELKTGILLSLKNDIILKAPKSSLVVYADFFKGYGKMIILDLGSDYHLIFSGLNKISCKTGDWLEKGSAIGSIKVNNNEIVYMEFRFKGKTINPSRWAHS
ncbi:peptidoglycan DD-metalloendopeptidase family protein [Alphaproteobacteria bacterium]|nr:peptidoglycan DD-metalloendopeptidase family protein [Alphaproteobacteria bacterium]